MEVANFNFGETASMEDMEYKTFRRRLFESLTYRIRLRNRGDDRDNGSESSLVDSYGSMT